MKLCSKCKANPRRVKGRYCTACHAADMRAWRKTQSAKPKSARHEAAAAEILARLKRISLKRIP